MNMKTDSTEERTTPEAYEDFFDYEEELYSPERYRQVNLLAVLSAVVGCLSILTMFHWYLGFIPVAGIVLAVLAQRQINRAPEEYTGQRLVIAGFALSIGMWMAGAGVLTFARMNEVPIGYELITWQTLKPEKSSADILPQSAVDLHEKRVYIKGYMYPGKQVINLKQLLLVPTQGHCQFCSSQIAKHEIVRVKFVGDYKADYTTHHVGIGGKLLVDQSPGFHESGGLPYTIEADVFQ